MLMHGQQRIGSSHHYLLRRLGLLGFVLSVLLLQTLGQLHAVKHGLKHGTAVAALHISAAHAGHAHHDHEVDEGHHDHAGASFLDQLFSQHGGDADCRLYDQLADNHAMPYFWALKPLTKPVWPSPKSFKTTATP